AEIALIVPAIEPVLIAATVDLGAAIGGADRDEAEAGLQRLQRVLAQLPARSDGEVGIIGNILHAVEARDLRMEKVAHEEAVAETYAAELLECPHALGFAHSAPPSVPPTRLSLAQSRFERHPEKSAGPGC